MPKGFLVKLQVTDMAITGQTGQCKDDKLVISDGYATLGLARSPSFEVYKKKNKHLLQPCVFTGDELVTHFSILGITCDCSSVQCGLMLLYLWDKSTSYL